MNDNAVERAARALAYALEQRDTLADAIAFAGRLLDPDRDRPAPGAWANLATEFLRLAAARAGEAEGCYCTANLPHVYRPDLGCPALRPNTADDVRRVGGIVPEGAEPPAQRGGEAEVEVLPTNVCLLAGRHAAHEWWYTSEGGGHMLSAADPVAKGFKAHWCPGSAAETVEREVLVGQALAETIPDGALDDETFDRVKAAVLGALGAEQVELDYTDIANRAQEVTGKGVMPSTVKAVLDVLGIGGKL